MTMNANVSQNADRNRNMNPSSLVRQGASPPRLTQAWRQPLKGAFGKSIKFDVKALSFSRTAFATNCLR
jgi:hypothetical protein